MQGVGWEVLGQEKTPGLARKIPRHSSAHLKKAKTKNLSCYNALRFLCLDDVSVSILL